MPVLVSDGAVINGVSIVVASFGHWRFKAKTADQSMEVGPDKTLNDDTRLSAGKGLKAGLGAA